MLSSDRHRGIEKQRRGPHLWFFATVGTLGFFTLIALLVLDPHHRMRIGVVAGMAGMFLTAQWHNLHLRTVNEKDDWLDVARRRQDSAEDEQQEVYYIEMGETRTPHGTTAPKRFDLGSSSAKAHLLATVIAGIWERYGQEWSPQALDEVAAAFRAGDDELARIVQERGTGPTTDVRIHVLRRESNGEYPSA